MKKSLEKSKIIKKTVACIHLEELIKVNAQNTIANLHLLYTINRENFIALLREQYTPEVLKCTHNIAQAIVYLITHNKNFLRETIENFSNQYHLDFHSLHVAIYAVNLGNLLNLEKNKLLELAIASLFIDIGLKMIDENITHEVLSLDTLTKQNIHLHPQYSIDILAHNHIHNPYIIEAVLHHHERYDGSGYPNALQKREISQYAAILGICDTFDALTNERPYRKQFTYFEALDFMLNHTSMQGKFNTQYLKIFLKSFT